MSGQPAGIVQARLTGAEGDVEAVAVFLAPLVLERQDRGGRVYLTLLGGKVLPEPREGGQAGG